MSHSEESEEDHRTPEAADTTRLAAELEAVKTEFQEFAHIVSHDLRAPLRAVGQLATWLREDHAENLGEDGEELIDLLQGRLDRLNNLLEGILQYSRMGRLREKKRDTDLGALVEQVIETIPSRGDVKVSVEGPLPVMRVEPTRIETLFRNLIDNAVKFMDKPDGRVKIECREEGDRWRFTVSDNGPGIDPAHHDRIFKIFQTIASRDEFETTGIGLTIAKKIVESNRGEIRLESEPGKGCAFRFTLPKDD
jgi:signal transduction histidine kinase